MFGVEVLPRREKRAGIADALGPSGRCVRPFARLAHSTFGSLIRSYIDDMLALVSFLVIGTGAAGQLIDGNTVDVPCRTGHLDCLFRNIIGTATGSIEDKHPFRC